MFRKHKKSIINSVHNFLANLTVDWRWMDLYQSNLLEWLLEKQNQIIYDQINIFDNRWTVLM